MNGRLDRFSGAYTKFQRWWQQQQVEWEERYRRQQEHIAKTEAFIRKNIAGQRTNQAKSRRKQLARLDRMEAPPNAGKRLRFSIEPARKSAAVVLEAHQLGQSFDELRLFEGLDLQILSGEKIGILGPNGCGKTTLLKILAREVTPTAGTIARGGNVDVGYYDQELRLVCDANTVLKEIQLMDPTRGEGDVRTLLGAFAFDADMVEQSVGTLSGGERARLSLLKLILERHNFLLLDEPTNHLDTDTREGARRGTRGLQRHPDRGEPRPLLPQPHLRSHRGLRRARRRWGRGAPVPGELRGHAPSPAGRATPAKRGSGSGARRPPVVKEAPAPDRPRRKRDLSKNELAKIRREILDLEEEIALLESDIEMAGEEMSAALWRAARWPRRRAACRSNRPRSTRRWLAGKNSTR